MRWCILTSHSRIDDSGMLSQIHAPALQHFRNRVCLRLICFTFFRVFLGSEDEQEGLRVVSPSSWLSSRPCPRSRSWSFARNETRHGPWSLCSLAAAFFFGQVSRDMRFARIMTSERPERASTPSSILYPAPAPTATCTPNTTKKELTTNHHINIINNSNSIPVPKHMHRFSTEAYNKKPHQNSANLGNVKK